MARLMSVALTEAAVVERRKTVTRRLGWRFLKPGDRLQLCRKVMGRRKGEPLVRLALVEVVDVNRQRLDSLTWADVDREGFPGWSPFEFVQFFCSTHKGCEPDTEVTRIEWRYLDVEACGLPLHKACNCVRPPGHDGLCNCAYPDGAPEPSDA